jgi:GT2 family glycosyltransferase
VSRTVAICICTRDRPQELRAALDAIAASTVPVRRVVVSDDGTDPGTQAVCYAAAATLPVAYTRGPGVGLSPNRNHALSLVDEDLVAFLDDDCLLGADFLATAMDCLDAAERTWGAGRVVVSGAERNHGRLITARAQDFLGFQRIPYAPSAPLSSIVINSTLFPRAALDRHRFDPQIRYGYEEVDLASRLAADGYRIVECVDAVNEHRPSPRGRDDYAAVVHASRLYVTAKRYALTDRRYARAAVYAVAGPAHAVASGARSDGLRGLRGGLTATSQAVRYLRRYAALARGSAQG